MKLNKLMKWTACTAMAATTAFASVPGAVFAQETSRVDAILAEMTTEEKITQTLMIDMRKWALEGETEAKDFTVMNDEVYEILADYKFGSFIFFAQNIKETEETFELTKAIQEASMRDGGLPLLITADQEGGSVYRLGSGTALPGNMALGATGSKEDAYLAGKIIGSELSVLGINTNLAPVVDVNNNPNNPVIGLRSYSDDPQLVGELASATIKGLDEYNVIGCAKHFPGHGDTATDSHYGLPSVDKSKEVLMENELKPYTVAIEEGIDMIMTAHILYPQLDDTQLYSNKTGKMESLPATLSKKIVTDLLKGEMGFDGVVSTDGMNMQGLADNWNQDEAVLNALAAGIDMICMPASVTSKADMAMIDNIIATCKESVENDGYLTMERLDDAVKNILTLKEEKGILDYNAEDYSLEKALEVVGSDENRAIERQIAADAATVVKNRNSVLPMQLNAGSKVVAFVPYNNERGQLAMAWNRGIEAGTVPAGASIEIIRFSGDTVLDAELKNKILEADYIYLNSEVSNASRMNGGSWLSKFVLDATAYARSVKTPSIVASVDKPYDVQSYEDADAILAVYGCKGSAVDPTEAIVGGATGSVAAYGPNIIAGLEVALGTLEAKGTLPVNVYKFDEATKSYDMNTIVYPRGFSVPVDFDADYEYEPGSMFRLYNLNSGEHFYTADTNERNFLVEQGWKFENVSWIAPEESDAPVYRLYNPNAGDHHYTLDEHEVSVLIKEGWNYEGIGWYSAEEDGSPVYRAYNPNAAGAGAHHFTSDLVEIKSLVKLGWKAEGIAWYGKAGTISIAE